ncbi:MAG TPA: glycine betaine ABC transporter substrate-binding protein [Candidatus Polarisedimenticolaceae bacterium]|nr:glycine betaine ABC transporter substrate-binding protein [Candidatus Polarisedimenticolaceae bacterium]
MSPRWCGAVLLSLIVLPRVAHDVHADTIVVGSKNFPENRLLAEMFAQVIEQGTELTVERKLSLAGTQICFAALEVGAIDLYPEYTGTGLVTILRLADAGDATETLNVVRREFRARYDLEWFAPLGFENAYELAVPRTLAEQAGLHTISDLVPIAPRLTAGMGYEFIEREDGLVGLRDTYGLRFGEVIGMQQALKYRAAAERRIDVLDVYGTDGRLLVADLVVLEDDRDFFPPYSAAPLVRGETSRRHPDIARALAVLAGALDERQMRRLNRRMQEEGEAVERVAADALRELGLRPRSSASEAGSTGAGLARYMWRQRAVLLAQTARHLQLTALALLAGVLVAVPLGMLLTRAPRLAEPLTRAVGVTQTIPSIALLAFMIPLLGVGFRPALVALWVYSIYPILRNTITALRDASPDAVDAARALGMTDRQILRGVRLPLALPVVLAGIRTSAVLTIGTATLAAFIGAGGLGEPIVSGLQLADGVRILSGAIPAAALAISVDALLGVVERRLTPRGVARVR